MAMPCLRSSFLHLLACLLLTSLSRVTAGNGLQAKGDFLEKARNRGEPWETIGEALPPLGRTGTGAGGATDLLRGSSPSGAASSSAHVFTQVGTWTALTVSGREPVRSLEASKLEMSEQTPCADDTDEDLPLVAVVFGSTTRGAPNVTLRDLALVRFLLPSFARTADCGFRYVIVMGYDVGDHFWDAKDGVVQLQEWLDTHIMPSFKRRRINVKYLPVRVVNDIKKPGPAFTAVTKAAYEAGAEFFYRVNDDTEMLNPWASEFVDAMQSFDNFGVVGPHCAQGNTAILTHDFTHRQHMDTFRGQYYPQALSDWWMDDWISRIYGHKRTRRTAAREGAEVLHHVELGTRYQVDMNHSFLLQGLVSEGNRRIRDAMAEQGAGPLTLSVFDRDSADLSGKERFLSLDFDAGLPRFEE